MTWNKDSEGNYYGASKNIEDALSLFFKILELLVKENRDVKWDVIRLELWPSSGRLIFFPATEPFLDRIEKTAAQISVKTLGERYEILSDDEDLEDDEFDEKYDEMIAEVMESLKKRLQTQKEVMLKGIEVVCLDSENGEDSDFFRLIL